MTQKMFCPGCGCVFETDDNYEIHAYHGEPGELEDCKFAASNDVLYEDCECGEDYVYLDEVNKLDILKIMAKTRR